MPQSVFDPIFLLSRAQLCGEWMVRNQVKDRFDANNGRGIRSYDMKTGHKVLTGNWMTGSMCMSLLALWKRTGDDRYLDAAERGGRYIMSLQIMDQRDWHYGAIREITPQSMEFAPRDATTGGWGLVWLYEATKKDIYLDRARLFGDFLVHKAMYRGWPMYAMYMQPDLEHFYSRGSFHSGTGLFFHDLFRVSGDQKYIERGMLPIATIYRDDFIRDDGTLILERDPFTGKVTDSIETRAADDVPMHAVNDDFGSAMMIAASRLFDDESFIRKSAAYAHWVASIQDEDGGYFGGKIPSGPAVSAMYMRDIGEILDDKVLIEAADRALKKVVETQHLDTGDPQMDGAFQGMYEGKEDDKWERKCVNMRATSYSLMALLKAESGLADIWLGAHNKPFRDHRWVGLHDLKF